MILDNGDFISDIKKPRSSEYEFYYNIFLKEGPRLATNVNNDFKFPQNVFFVTKECGINNAYYLPSNKTIVICYEIMEFIFNITSKFETSFTKTEIDELRNGAINFIIFHDRSFVL